MAIRAIRLSKMVEIDSVVTNPNETIGADNVAVCVGNAGLNTWGKTSVSVINRGHDFEFLTGGGNALELAGFFRGTGRFHVAQGTDMPVTLSGKVPNPFHGTWLVHQGILALAKPAGITALAGKVIVGGGKGAKDAISWRAPHQVDDAASVELLLGSAGAARLLLNGCDEKFGTLSMVSGTRIVTDGNKKSGNLVLDTLVLDGKPLPQGIYAGGCHWIEGNGLTEFALIFPPRLIATEKRAVDLGRTGKSFTSAGRTYHHGTPYGDTGSGCRCAQCLLTGHTADDHWRDIWYAACEASGIGWRPRIHNCGHARYRLSVASVGAGTRVVGLPVAG